MVNPWVHSHRPFFLVLPSVPIRTSLLSQSPCFIFWPGLLMSIWHKELGSLSQELTTGRKQVQMGLPAYLMQKITNIISCQLNSPRAEKGLVGEEWWASVLLLGTTQLCFSSLVVPSRMWKGSYSSNLYTVPSSGWLMTRIWVIFLLSNSTHQGSRASELFCWQVVLVNSRQGVEMLKADF